MGAAVEKPHNTEKQLVCIISLGVVCSRKRKENGKSDNRKSRECVLCTCLKMTKDKQNKSPPTVSNTTDIRAVVNTLIGNIDAQPGRTSHGGIEMCKGGVFLSRHKCAGLA